MAEQIIIKPDLIWDYWNAHKEELRDTMHKVAENTDYGVEIYLSNDREMPLIEVFCDDLPLYSEEMVSFSDTQRSVKRIYDKYLSNKLVSELSGNAKSVPVQGKRNGEREDDYVIAEREDELSDAVVTFIASVCDCEEVGIGSLGFDEICEDVKEHMLEYIARKHGIPIYRPMYLVDNAGERFFTEYPYENMIFDDPDNPIYK